MSAEPYLIQVIEDISHRKQTEAQLDHMTRARRVMAECNHILIHAVDESEMLGNMCRIVVASGGYKMAWVGLATGDVMRPVRPAAHAGYGDDAPMSAPVGWSADGRYQGFMLDVVATGEPHIARDILNDPKYAQRRARAIQHGFRSSIALPLTSDDEILGALAIYAQEADAFDPEEIALLSALAGDIAYGISNLRSRIARQQAEQAARENERRFELTFNNAPVGILHTSLERRILLANQKFLDIIGYTLEELQQMPAAGLSHPEDVASDAHLEEQLLKGTIDTFASEKRYISKHGRVIWTRRTTSVARDTAGAPQYYIRVIDDVTETKLNEERYRAIFENAAVGITRVDLDGVLVDVNQKFCDMLGYVRDELIGKSVKDVTHADDYGQGAQFRGRVTQGEMKSAIGEKRFVRSDGTIIWARRTMSVARDDAGNPRYVISVVEDISERKRAEEQLTHLAHYDVLTNLPNRVLFYDRLRHALAQARRHQYTVGVMFIDVDRFKNINDTLGHAVGDILLQQVSQRLSGAIRTADTVGRLGGDEFAIVLSSIAAADHAQAVADKIIAQFSEPFRLGKAEVYVTASVGITLYPHDATDQDALIRNADIAMYRAKEEGRNTYAFYSLGMQSVTAQRLDMEVLLRRALERMEFVLHYQPKIAVKTGRIIGAEALIRWNSAELGMVPPMRFIPLAEETGLIAPIGEWVLRTACAQGRAWASEGRPALLMSVNLSARQFQQKNLMETIAAILEETRFEPRHLELEITESMIMQHAGRASAVLQRLKETGVQLTIDDFGTGYSSLAYLKRFPVQRVKIDQSFVRDITTDSDDAAIVKAVIAMARSLKLKTVAEGVETKEQLAFLARLRCDEYQGYYFSRPVPAEDFVRLPQFEPKR